MEEYAKHEKDLIRKYEEKGYDHSFRHENGNLIDLETDTSYSPEDIAAVEEHRYEGMSNPSDLSILYALKMSDGTQGTFLMAYGPNADVETTEFFNKVPDKKFDAGAKEG